MTISERIKDIESKVDVRSFRYRGEEVWPVIRMSIYLGTTRFPKEKKQPAIKALLFLLGGGVRLIAERLSQLVRPLQFDAVFVTTSHYKVREGETFFDRIIDPPLQFVKQAGRSVKVWEFTGKFIYDSPISYAPDQRKIQQEIVFLSALRRVTGKFKPKENLIGDVSAVNNLLQQHDLPFRLDTKFNDKLSTIFFQADFFERNLKRYGVRRVFAVCYYDVKCFAVILAANRLKIKSVDLQHGVQGEGHMAYAQMPAALAEHSRFLPSHFFVWDKPSQDAILRWKKETTHVLLGVNKWFADRAKKIGNDIILVTLQPIDDFLPEYLIRKIQEHRGTEKWFIRLHPRQLDQMDAVAATLRAAGVLEKTDLETASFSPLTDLLSRTLIHVTVYSSVAIEAGYYHTPTYFLDQTKMHHYIGYLPEELRYFYPQDDLLEVIRQVDKTVVNFGAETENRIDVLSGFLND